MDKYYQLEMDDSARWTLALGESFADGTPVDIWSFRKGRLLGPQVVPITLYSSGKAVDYNPTAFGALIVSARLGDLIASISGGDVQLLPTVSGLGDWLLVNVLPVVDCIDLERSQLQFFPPTHSRSGDIRGVIRLRLDPARTGGHRVLIPQGWSPATIVHESVKEAIEAAGMTGIAFTRVS